MLYPWCLSVTEERWNELLHDVRQSVLQQVTSEQLPLFMAQLFGQDEQMISSSPLIQARCKQVATLCGNRLQIVQNIIDNVLQHWTSLSLPSIQWNQLVLDMNHCLKRSLSLTEFEPIVCGF